MRTFERITGKSKKFWHIEHQGKQVTVTAGRGKAQTTTWKNAAEAEAECDELIQEKLAEGYVETTNLRPLPPLQVALEKALVHDPDNLANHAAYADFLTEQNDPRGEFIQVQMALEDPGRSPKERERLQKREQALLKKHGLEWLGNLAEQLFDLKLDRRYYRQERQNFQFARGWLDTLDVSAMWTALAQAIAHAPQVRLLRQLLVQGTDWWEIRPLLRSPYLGNIRVFQIGKRYEDSSRWGLRNGCTTGQDAVRLIRKMPRLEELYLMAHNIDTERLFSLKTLTNLRVLEVDHERRYPLERLAANRALARLESLTLHPHGLADGDAPYIQLAGLRALVRSHHLQSLRRLALRVTDAGDEGCKEVSESGILKRLKILELTHGCITDEGAAILANCPEIRNLELLNLSYNALTAEGIQRLKQAGINLRADEQHNAAEIEDRMHLYEGDSE